MASLRTYYYNGGNMLELVHYQKKEHPETQEEERPALSNTQILNSEISRHRELGKYLECMMHSLKKGTFCTGKETLVLKEELL